MVKLSPLPARGKVVIKKKKIDACYFAFLFGAHQDEQLLGTNVRMQVILQCS